MASDWFRSDAWDDDARKDFELRLGRASIGNRPQYLRIKGLALSSVGQDDAARELWLRVLRDFPESLDAPAAMEHLGDLERQLGSTEVAEDYYRELLRRSPNLGGTTGIAEVSLAEVLIDRNNEPNRNEALKLLETALHRGNMFPNQLFRWHVALAKAASDMGDLETQQRAARTALRLVKEAKSPFPRHPTVGVVLADEATVGWLEELAAGLGPTRRTTSRLPKFLRKR